MRRRPTERRAFAIAAAVAVALHVMFLDIGFGPDPTGSASAPPPVPSIAVRTIVAVAPAPEPNPPPPPIPEAPILVRPSRPAPSRATDRNLEGPRASLAPSPERDDAAPRAVAASVPEVPEPEPESQSTLEASAPSPPAIEQPKDLGTPPPTYRVLLPPPLTVRYEVRRGFLRGTGEIRWQPDGDAYTMRLEARVGSLVLLVQSSAGSIGEFGLVPRRYVDQRMRRSAQAANFDADAARITFSGPQTTYPLFPGTQDRLSIFVQLAGIAAADPSRLTDGATFAMVVVGARGDASLWTLRVAGREAIETAAGTVQAIKVVREGRGPSESTAEIWLDPGRHYLPAHATLRTASGASEYDLLLEGVSSGP